MLIFYQDLDKFRITLGYADYFFDLQLNGVLKSIDLPTF
jgi:hypothetical protein